MKIEAIKAKVAKAGKAAKAARASMANTTAGESKAGLKLLRESA